MTVYGNRAGEAYEDESGRIIYEVDENHAYRTGRNRRGLWIVHYGPHTPGGFRERQIQGEINFSVRRPVDLKRRFSPAVPDHHLADEANR